MWVYLETEVVMKKNKL